MVGLADYYRGAMLVAFPRFVLSFHLIIHLIHNKPISNELVLVVSRP
jgi:hypothetical protein